MDPDPNLEGFYSAKLWLRKDQSESDIKWAEWDSTWFHAWVSLDYGQD